MAGIVKESVISTDPRSKTQLIIVDNGAAECQTLEQMALARDMNKFAAWCDAEKRPVFKERGARGSDAAFRYQATNLHMALRDGVQIPTFHVCRLACGEQKQAAFLMPCREFEKQFKRED